jgi:hypothetical protein
MIPSIKEKMSILWLNRPCRCIIHHTRAKTKTILRVGLLCTRYICTVNYLFQTIKITPSTQTHMMESSIKQMGYKGALR